MAVTTSVASFWAPHRSAHSIGSLDEASTRTRQAVDQFSESAARHRAILQTAMDGFWLVDIEGHLLEVNEAYCRMSGYSAQELRSMCMSDLDTNETTGDTAGHIRSVIARGEDRFEARHKRKDGGVFDVEISVQYRPTAGGRLVLFLRVMPDMNGRDLARHLLALYPQMKRLFMSGDTAGVIAHQGVLDDGVDFVQKPFGIHDLAAKVRQALNRT